MALTYAILALLVDEAQSGYDLMKRFDGSVGCFWKATHQQIYRELSKLEEQGWVTAEILPQVGRPDKRLHRMTPLGQQQLADWIAEPCDLAPTKEALLIKVFVGTLAPQALRQELDRHRQLHAAKLADYERVAATYYPQPAQLPFDQQLQHLVLRRGIRFETDWLGWCDEALQLLIDHVNDRPV